MNPTEPLAGIRVLDLTSFLSGPLVTRALADLGAEIIKIEPPGGDPTRGGVDQPTSGLWTNVHRGRKSVVIDLKCAAGRKLLLALAEKADIFVENFRPGTTERLGIAPEAVRAANPSLIYCTITGYGQDGPLADQAAIDGPIQALAGTLELATLNGLPPMPMPVTIADIAGASAASQAVLAALLARERSGTGCTIDVSLFEAVLPWVLVNRRASLAPPVTLVLESSEGGSVLVQTPMHFHGRLLALVARVPGFEAVATDSRFATGRDARDHIDDYHDVMRDAFARRPRHEWLAALQSEGIPAAPVHTVDEAVAHPQLIHRQAIAPRSTPPATGEEPVMLSPYRFDGERRTVVETVPRLAQHTREVLAAMLGHDDAAIDELTTQGAFGPGPVPV